jgi:AcrR family transcriptional regulator
MATIKAKGKKTKQMILEKSLQCFVKRGFEGASLFELAKSCNTHKPLIIHYYSTIENLQLEVLKFVAITGREFTMSFLASEQKIKILLVRYVRSQFAWLKKYPHHGSYVVLCLQRSTHDKQIQALINLFFESSKARISEFLSGDNSSSRALQVHTMLLGALILAITEGSAHFQQYEDQCLAAVAKL